MSVAGILSSLGSLQLGAPGATKQGLQQLKQDLQTGNLKAAQSDFAALQKAFSKESATSAANSHATNPTASSGSTSASSSSNARPFSQAVHQLASDLTSNNLAAAQKDFSALKEELPQANGLNSAGGARHHHSSGGAGDNSQNSGGTTPSALFTQLSQALASGNMASAQQAYASLQAQQFSALSAGQPAADSPMSMLA
jgi:outer membrane protein assembly factor BamD (BamD/ComL family)